MRLKRLLLIFPAVLILSLIGMLIFSNSESNILKQGENEEKGVIKKPVFASPELLSLNNAFVEIVKKIKPAVVKVESQITVKERYTMGEDIWEWFFGEPFRSPRRREVITQSFGSGFIISSDGYIMTNNHLAENAKKIIIYIGGSKKYTAQIVGTDKKTDIALLKINGKNFPFAGLGDSSKIQIGEWVLAIGNPFGNYPGMEGEPTVTAGIISAKGRQLRLADYEDFIQTDAPINRGNSGGPLVNIKGEVIGITSAILAPTGTNLGIGFAIPINLAKTVCDELKAKGRVIRGWLGVGIQDFTEELSKDFGGIKEGAIIASVQGGSPAEKAGLKRYDVIIEFDGKKISNGTQLRFAVAETPPNKKVNVKIIRDGKEKNITVEIGELEEETSREEIKEEFNLGLKLEPLTPEIARRYGYPRRGGLIVTDVEPFSAAYEAGLAEGDLVLEVNRKPVNSISDFMNILRRSKSGDTLILLVWRNGQEFFRYLTIP
ncbi:MAG: Do family serine endopeptidase [Acidobacteriota bacterium]